MQLGTLYQQPFETYLHHHPVSAAISKLNFLAEHVALIHHNPFMIALLKEWANINYLTYLLQEPSKLYMVHWVLIFLSQTMRPE